MAIPDAPRYRPDPTRLTAEGYTLLEQFRVAQIPNYSLYRRERYKPIGGVSQYDSFILRRGKVLHVQGARNFVGEQITQKLQDDYRRRGKEVEVIAEKGAVFVKRGRRQKDVSHERDFTYHESGVTFYVRDVSSQSRKTTDIAASVEIDVREPSTTVPQAFAMAFA